MKSLVSLLRTLLQDCSSRCRAPVLRDVEVLSLRVEHEGDSFLTITLPSFCSDFERCLSEGRIGPSAFAGFGKVGCRPAFMQAFMSKVFDKSGLLLKDPSTDCILAIRQVCLFAKKILRPCTAGRLKSAEDKFLLCEREINNSPSGELWHTFQIVSRIVLSTVLSDTMYEDLKPKHGPGVTAERLRGNSKFVHRRWTKRLENQFPFTEFGVASVRNLPECFAPSFDFSEPETEIPVRVVFVPKTLKAPRVIAIEPVCMQYAQQAYSKWLVSRLESGRTTNGHINFRDQGVNQVLAKSSSRDGKFATIDMSDASDRVSLAMAKAAFDCFPFFLDGILSCRSTSACLPSGNTIPLEKFASMGSALCFPVEAVVFFLAIVSARLIESNSQITARSIYTLSRDVFVYGDDLIVPADEALSICAHLEAFGLKVNGRKTFWTGKFRESCGMDCYDGVEVTPCYLRSDIPADRTDVSALLSSVATCNQLFRAGYYRTSLAIKEAVEDVWGKLPTVPNESAAIGWSFYSEYDPPKRWNVDLQRSEIRCLVPFDVMRDDPLSDDAALVKCFGLIGSDADLRPDHLLKSVGSWSLATKTRWVPAH